MYRLFVTSILAVLITGQPAHAFDFTGYYEFGRHFAEMIFKNAPAIEEAAVAIGLVAPKVLLFKQRIHRFDKNNISNCKPPQPKFHIQLPGWNLGVRTTHLATPTGVRFSLDGRDLNIEDALRQGENYNIAFKGRLYLMTVTGIEECSAEFTILQYSAPKS